MAPVNKYIYRARARAVGLLDDDEVGVDRRRRCEQVLRHCDSHAGARVSFRVIWIPLGNRSGHQLQIGRIAGKHRVGRDFSARRGFPVLCTCRTKHGGVGHPVVVCHRQVDIGALRGLGAVAPVGVGGGGGAGARTPTAAAATNRVAAAAARRCQVLPQAPEHCRCGLGERLNYVPRHSRRRSGKWQRWCWINL